MDRETALEQLSLRLSHMADGVDPELDQLLESIRKAVREGVRGSKLDDLSSRLARSLMTSAGIDIDKGPTIDGGYDLSGLRKLIRSMPVESEEQERMHGLVRQAAAGQTSVSRQKALVELLGVAAEAIQGSVMSGRGQGKVMGWLGKKSNGDDTDERYVSLFAALLQRLVEHIDVLNGSPLRSAEIRDALDQILHPMQAKELLREVTDEIERIDSRIRAERSQTTDFLGDLRERLDGFEDVITLLSNDTTRSLERSEGLQSDVDEDARSLGDAAAAGDVEEIRGLIKDGLARIMHRLSEHVIAEREQHEQSQDRVGELTERLAALENEADMLRSELRSKNDLALKDALTGAYNRAGYEERTRELYARWKRAGAALSLVFVDCNRFKHINDTYGHAAGDLVLVKVSDVLHGRARASDIVCRYGGDEFVILLPDTAVEGAEVFARSACQEIIDAGFNDNGKPIDVSISCGVTQLIEGDEMEDAMGRADEAMYEAKKMKGICVAVKV
ncbi:MAG: diguanylate cyclase [Pseudomonadota bacterium]